MIQPLPNATLFPYTTLFRSLTRGEFLRRLAMITGSTAAAMAVLPMIESNYAHAAVTPDQDLFTERISYPGRSEEHTSELQSQSNLVCRLLLEKKKQRQSLLQ